MMSSARRSAIARSSCRGLASCLAALLLPAIAYAQVEVSLHAGRMDVSASAAPLSDVLDRIATSIGAEVEYEGAPPRQLVTLALADRTPAEAVLSVLDGLAIDFAMQLDASGTRFATLLVADSSNRPVGRPPLPPPPPEPSEPPPIQDFPSQLQELFNQANVGDAAPEDEDPEPEPAPEERPAAQPTPLMPALPPGPLVFPNPFGLPRGPAPTPTPP